MTRFYKAASGQEIVNLPQLSGAAAQNRDNVNPILMNVAFRLLYSPKSCILTVHFVSFNPYTFSTLDPKQKQQLPLLTQSQQIGWQESDMGAYLGRLSAVVDQPAPNRPLIGRKKTTVNRRKEDLYQLNGLRMHQVPLCGHFSYGGTEDIVEFRGLGKRNKNGLMR